MGRIQNLDKISLIPFTDDTQELIIKNYGKLTLGTIQVILALNKDQKAISFKKMSRNRKKCYLQTVD